VFLLKSIRKRGCISYSFIYLYSVALLTSNNLANSTAEIKNHTALPSELSTTQLFNTLDKKIDIEVCKHINFYPSLFKIRNINEFKVVFILVSFNASKYNIIVLAVQNTKKKLKKLRGN